MFCLGESCVADLAASVPVLGILKDHPARAGPTGPAALDELSKPLQVAVLSQYFTTAARPSTRRRRDALMRSLKETDPPFGSPVLLIIGGQATLHKGLICAAAAQT